MATAQFAQRGPTPNAFKSDLDMDTFFDFNQSTFTPPVDNRTTAQAGSSKQAATAFKEEPESFAGPSHEYDRFPQQTGVGISFGDMNNLANLNQPMHGDFGGFNSGIDENSFGMNWDADSDVNMGMASMNFNGSMKNGTFVDPTFIDTEEPQSNVGRLWPGMHQQAALAKQQQQQQKQQQQQLQRQTPQQQDFKGKGKAPVQTDRHTEESISRLLNQMRQNSTVSVDDDASSQAGFSSSRLRKDEEDMDEDERLLASEEGKKLSSKERRQLRNKVSARAFRSRRKEYIGQLEGEVAAKAQEVSTLKADKDALSEENARYRALIQTLLRHPSFTPFIEDISKDPAFIAAQSARQSSGTPVPHTKPSRSSELAAITENENSFTPSQQQQNMHFDFSQPQFYPQQNVPALDLGQQRSGAFY